jgi:Co/Zn/Cd efflux system component
MSEDCCAPPEPPARAQDGQAQAEQARWRRTLWMVLAINAVMFVVEVAAGLLARSSALQADALDFFGDAANYAISLGVLGMAASVRAKAALFKGVSMGAFGVWVLGVAVWNMAYGVVPEAPAMGAIGLLALVANLACLYLLTGFRTGDANMQSVWVCARNDVIGNFAVLVAAGSVIGTGTGFPDAIVAAIMGTMALFGAWQIVQQARSELKAA